MYNTWVAVVCYTAIEGIFYETCSARIRPTNPSDTTAHTCCKCEKQRLKVCSTYFFLGFLAELGASAPFLGTGFADPGRFLGAAFGALASFGTKGLQGKPLYFQDSTDPYINRIIHPSIPQPRPGFQGQ